MIANSTYFINTDTASIYNYSLSPVTDIYQKLQENSSQEYYFLDENNTTIKVKSIEKAEYNGKIYDVDVPSDIILVRRCSGDKNLPCVPVWSGNSNTKAVDISRYHNDGTIVTGSSWWSDSYLYRKKITLTNTGPATVYIGDPINFTIDTAALISQGKLLSNGNDLRVACGGNEVNRTNTTAFNTSATIIWFKSCLQINSGSNSGSNIYLYYGNSAAGSPQTGGINTTSPFNLTQSFDVENIVRAQYVPGKFGSGLQFDGGDDYVDAGNGASLNITNAITLEAWVLGKSFNPTGTWMAVLSKEAATGGYAMQVNKARQSIGFQFYSGGSWRFSPEYAISPNTWYHVVGTYDGTVIRLDVLLNNC